MEAIVQPHLHSWAALVAELETVVRHKLLYLPLPLGYSVQAGSLGVQAAGLEDD